jgi:pentatricopeptide repeat protein
VTTFTVFFLAFTAVMGKDLVSVDHDSLNKLDSKSILSTCAKPQNESKQIANLVDEIVMMGVDDDDDLPQTPSKEKRHQSFQKSPPRNRFNEKLSTLKIMEARETAKAELGIAFEMLKMMKERGLRADPEAYECLIDACGRCGDTDRATQLLSRMHEDGIIADGVVYSSLVTAFSAENAWKRVSGEFQEELPGKNYTKCILLRHLYAGCSPMCFHLFRMGKWSINGHGLERA